MQSATLLPPAETRRPTTHGLAELSLERRDGRTRLAHARTRPPLIVQRALYPDDAAPDLAHVFLSNPTGGLFSGDRQEVRIEVGRGARAHVTTQSATKIYTMERGKAEQRVVLNVAAGGYLEYLPDPLIPFSNSSLEQDFCITVDSEGTSLWWDIITPGRVAMRESFQYRSVRNRLAVYRDNQRAVFREAFDLSPQESTPNGIGLVERSVQRKRGQQRLDARFDADRMRSRHRPPDPGSSERNAAPRLQCTLRRIDAARWQGPRDQSDRRGLFGGTTGIEPRLVNRKARTAGSRTSSLKEILRESSDRTAATPIQPRHLTDRLARIRKLVRSASAKSLWLTLWLAHRWSRRIIAEPDQAPGSHCSRRSVPERAGFRPPRLPDRRPRRSRRNCSHRRSRRSR